MLLGRATRQALIFHNPMSKSVYIQWLDESEKVVYVSAISLPSSMAQASQSRAVCVMAATAGWEIRRSVEMA